MKLKALLLPVIALAVLPGSAAIASHAQPGYTLMARHHRSRGVYVCKMCKAAYSPAMAMKMNFKDSMGHKLVHRRSMPHGYTMGAMSHM